MTVSLLNTSSQAVTVEPGSATLMTVESDSEVGSAALVARDGFDGKLAPGASITVTYQLRSTPYAYSADEVYYKVQLVVGGKTLEIKSPPTYYRAPPA